MFSILIAKMALFAGNLLHRGSALPGSIALKLNKNILEKFKLPKNIYRSNWFCRQRYNF